MNELLKVSIIIPTYNRIDDLKKCLNSIFLQIYKPSEIIIVDDSTSEIVEEYIHIQKEKWLSKKVELIYIKNSYGKSLTKARNIGIDVASGNILCFLDDDVILNENYIFEIVSFFMQNPNTIGAQGYVTNTYVPKFYIELCNKIFMLNHLEKNKCRVLRSSHLTYPKECPDKPISCEWLSGCNHAYRKTVFNEFRYDEKLIEYSLKEDADLSYRVNKKYPNQLRLIPSAKCVHNVSSAGRMPKISSLYMEYGYLSYFFYKNVNRNIIESICFKWSMVGKILKNILEILIRSNSKQQDFCRYLKAIIDIRKYIEDIKDENILEFGKSVKKL